MTDDKDALPSDAEKGALKPEKSKDRELPPPQTQDDKKAEKDPSEQPS